MLVINESKLICTYFCVANIHNGKSWCFTVLHFGNFFEKYILNVLEYRPIKYHFKF